jgi:hypothetical protein
LTAGTASADALGGLIARWNPLVPALVILPPFFLLLHFVTGSDLPLGLFAALQSFLLLVAAAVWAVNSTTERISGAEIAFVLFCWILGLATLVAMLRFPELASVPMSTPLISFLLWCSPIFTIPVLVRTHRDLSLSLGCIDALGYLLVLSVLLPAIGLEFGEVQESEVAGLRRVFGPFGDSIALIMGFFLVDSASRASWWRCGLYGSALLLTVGLGATLVAVVSLLALAKVVFTGGSASLTRIRPWQVISATVAISSAILLAAGGLQTRLASPELAVSLGLRLSSMISAWNVFVDNLWLGVGYTGLKAVSERYRPEALFEVFSTNYTSTAQNQLLQTATDAGILGVVALVLMVAYALLTMRRASRLPHGTHFRYRGFWAWSLGLCLANQTSVWLLPNSLVPFLFFLVTGLSVARLKISRTRP